MDTAIVQQQSKSTIRSILWRLLLSLGAALQDALAVVSVQPSVVVRTHDGYRLPTNPAANNAAETPTVAELSGVAAQLRKTRRAKAPVVVRLGDDDVLFRGRTFPKAVTDVIEPVLHNQIQKLVPWTENDIAFGYIIEREANSNEQVHAQLAITRQSVIDRIRSEANAAGLHLVAIDSTDEASPTQPIQIYSESLEQKERFARQIGRVLIGLALTSFALSAVALSQFAYSTWRMYEIENSIANQKNALNKALLVQKAREKSDERVEAMIAQKRNQMPRIAVVNELSKRLPDKTWLESLEVRDNVAILSGYSDNAAAIVRLLDEAEEFTDVKFIGATELSTSAGRERFQISVRISKYHDGADQ